MRLLFAILFVSLASIVVAQPHKMRQDRALEIIQSLDLSVKQRSDIKQLRDKYRDLFQHNIRVNPNREVRREKRRALQRDFRQEIQQVLTPTQLRALRMKLREQGDKSRLKETLAELELSAEQRKQIKAILHANRSRASEIKSNTALSPEERRHALGAIKQETMTSLEHILDDEQARYLRQRMEKRKQHHRAKRLENRGRR